MAALHVQKYSGMTLTQDITLWLSATEIHTDAIDKHVLGISIARLPDRTIIRLDPIPQDHEQIRNINY
ncbi:hypothetical protein DSUL_20531 [Desulfovibrionales bacterium]